MNCMNKNNGLIVGIIGLLVVIIGAIIVIALTREDLDSVALVPVEQLEEQVVTPNTNTVSNPAPIPTGQYVAEPVVSIIVPAPTTPPVKVPAKAPVAAVSTTGKAPQVTTLGTSSLSKGGVVLHGMLETQNAESYYAFQYGPTTNLGDATRYAPIDGSTSAIEVMLATWDLTPGTTYYYRLVAQNAFGKVQGTIKNFVTLNATGPFTFNYDQALISSSDARAPQVVTQEASSVSSNSAVLNGVLNTRNVETYYSFQYGLTDRLGYETRVAPIAASMTSENIALAAYNLNPATQYYYRLHAHNEFGIVYGVINRFTTPQN